MALYKCNNGKYIMHGKQRECGAFIPEIYLALVLLFARAVNAPAAESYYKLNKHADDHVPNSIHMRSTADFSSQFQIFKNLYAYFACTRNVEMHR